MKKYKILGVVLIIFIVVGIFVKMNFNDKGDSVMYVDDTIKKILSSEEYKEGDLSERKKLVEETLLNLQKNKYISDVFYEEEINYFSFQYLDKTLGGIKIEEFSKDGFLPMN
jgi:hypothetical protein